MSLRNYLSIALAATLLCAAGAVQAATVILDVDGGDYATASSWNTNVPPTTGDSVIIGHLTYPNYAATLASDVSGVTPSLLYLGYGSGGTLTLNTGASLDVDSARMGYTYAAANGDGAIVHNNGALNVNDDLYVCFGSGNSGTYTMHNGTLDVGGALYLGRHGTGLFTLNGGTATINGESYIGLYSDGDGTLAINGGTVDFKSHLYAGYDAGNPATINQTAGDLFVRGATGFILGENGDANYNVSGGTLDVENGDLVLGSQTGSSGTIVQSGGRIDAYGVKIKRGSITVSGGSLNTDGIFRISGNSTTDVATLNIEGDGEVASTYTGSVQVAYGNAYGIINQTGGTFSTTNDLSLGNYNGAEGVYNISGGEAIIGRYLHMGYATGSEGTLIQSGGTISTTVGGCYLGTYGSGSYQMSGGTANFTGGLHLGRSAATGSFIQTGGIINAGGLTVSHGRTGTISGGTMNCTGHMNIGHSADTAYLNIQDTAVVDVAAFTKIGYDAGDNGVINQTGGTVSIAKLIVGESGNGTYNISDGSLYVGGIDWGGIYVGYYAGGYGDFNQSGGDVDADRISLGADGGDGEMTVTGGAMTAVEEFSIGGNAASTGVMTVTGGAVESESSLYVGHRGIGTLNLTGGTFTVADRTAIGYDDGATGSLDFGAGTGVLNTKTLMAAPTQVTGSSGTINTNGLVSDVALVLNDAGDLSQTLNWGSGVSVNLDLTTPANNGILGAGWNGTGSLAIGGDVTVTSEDGYLGWRTGSSGTATVSGNATWNVGYLVIGRNGTGVLNFTGGTINIAGDEIETRSAGTGTFNFQGGTLKDLGVLNRTAVNLQSGGSGAVFQQANNAGLVNSDISGDGTLTKTGAEALALAGANSYTGLTTVQEGTLQMSGAAAWNPVVNLGGADIQAGQMVFDYSGESTPATTIKGLLTTSYNNGDWDVGKFLSTTADGSHGLGWLDDAGNEAVTVMYTLYGDAELNGLVDFDDLNIVLSNYNDTGVVWAEGDFDYDDDVDFDDLNLVLSNYNQSLGMLNVGGFGSLDSQALAALSAAGFNVVPEPSALVLLACGLAAAVTYAWRKRR